MKKAFEEVSAFNTQIIGLPFAPRPKLVLPSRMLAKQEHMEEELIEIGDAYAACDIVGVADGVIDLIYVALGLLHESGIDAPRVWDAVHRANMAKVGGRSTKRKFGTLDAIKPAGWSPPDHSWLVTAPSRGIVNKDT